MPSEPSDGIFDAPAVYGRGAGAGKYPYRHCRQHRNLETRHSRAGGNLERRTEETVLPDKFPCGQV
ncbi:TPA: hypothetical protein WK609_001847 [Neisseria gonorrhoeae]